MSPQGDAVGGRPAQYLCALLCRAKSAFETRSEHLQVGEFSRKDGKKACRKALSEQRTTASRPSFRPKSAQAGRRAARSLSSLSLPVRAFAFSFVASLMCSSPVVRLPPSHTRPQPPIGLHRCSGGHTSPSSPPGRSGAERNEEELSLGPSATAGPREEGTKTLKIGWGILLLPPQLSSGAGEGVADIVTHATMCFSCFQNLKHSKEKYFK